MTTVPLDVSKVAVATGEACPTAAVSLVILAAVAVPLLDALKGVLENVKVATAVPGELIFPAVRNTSFGLVPNNAITASQAALRAATE